MGVENVEAYVTCDICTSMDATIQLIEFANETWGIDETDALETNSGYMWSYDGDVLECNFCISKAKKGEKT